MNNRDFVYTGWGCTLWMAVTGLQRRKECSLSATRGL